MIELKSGRTVGVDCDETLINWTYPIDSKGLITLCNDQNQCRQFEPHWKNIEFLKSLKVQGYTVIVWSAGSGKWATKVVKALGIEEYVDLTCDKLEFAVDDTLDARKIIKQVLWIDPITGEYRRNE